MQVGDRDLRPALGCLLVEQVEMGMVGSLIMPSPSGGTEGKHLVVRETAAGHFAGGTFVESPYKSGDYIVLRPSTKDHPVILASLPHFPKGHFLCELRDVIGYERPTATAH